MGALDPGSPQEGCVRWLAPLVLALAWAAERWGGLRAWLRRFLAGG